MGFMIRRAPPASTEHGPRFPIVSPASVDERRDEGLADSGSPAGMIDEDEDALPQRTSSPFARPRGRRA
jgi:hypothetical protein